MKVLTWNINGIRASKRTLKDVLDELDADVICLQETKITRDMMDEPSAIVEGYNAYFSFSRKRSGYSGTANFCRDSATPTGAEEGLSGQLTSQSEGGIGCYSNTEEFEEEELRSLDGEGRAILTQHQIELGDRGVREVVIINVYVPRAAERDERLTYKLRFLALLQARAESLLRHGKHVIVLGDINTTHKRIDHCDPSCQEYLRADSRKWIDQFLWPEDRDPDLAAVDEINEAIVSGAEGGHFIDAFRFFHRQQTEAYTNWSTVTAARQTNYGKRLDYIFVDSGLRDFLRDCRILADFEGSDHCPMVVELDCPVVRSSRCPPLCTRYMPEFSGRQQKLLRFFSSSSARSAAATVPATPASGKTSRHRSGESSSISVPEEEDRGGGNCGGAADKGEQKCRALLAASSSSLTLSSSTSSSPLSSSSTSSSSQQRQQQQLCGRGEGEGEKSPLKVAVKRSSSSFHSNQGDKPPTTHTKKKKTGMGKGERGRRGGEGGVEGAGVSRQGSLLSFFRKAAVAPPSQTPSTITTTPSLNPSTPPPPPPSSTTTGSGSEGATTTTTTNSSSSPSPSKLWLSSLTLIPEKKKTTMMKDETRKGQTSEPSRLSPAARSMENGSSDDEDGSQEEQGHTTTSTTTPGKSARGWTMTMTNPRQEHPESHGPGTEPPPLPATTQSKAKCAWRSLLSGPPPAPPCKGHREPCVLRTVKKAGPTKGRQFYVCARPEGLSTNKEARCEHFQWVNYMAAAGGKKKSKT